MQAMEAESMREAAAGLWSSGSTVVLTAPPPVPDPVLGMPPLATGMLLADSGNQQADFLVDGDLLAGLRLDASEPQAR